MSERLVTVGEVRGVYGVKGWVKLFSYTAPRENLLGYREFLTGRGETLRLVEARPQGKGLIGRFAGCDDRDEAIALHGTVLRVERSALPETEEGEFYWDDLVGLEVVDVNAGSIGTVDYLLETGADDVMVVKRPGGGEELVPFAWERVVKRVELDPGRITVDWPSAAADAEEQ